MKILLAVDGSAYTKKMLAYLATHAEMFGPNNAFSLITVQLPLPPRARAAVGAEEANSYYAEEAEKVTAPVVKFLKRHGIDPKIIHKVGSPGELIAKAGDSGKFDLVMMGSHGHSALGNLVMGSVATQVLAHCGVPVMMVR
ncbi:MAG: universal stress protein [Hydrogenophaga sp.]|jgi:nucleotide-binding universal stress UspA family protein|uniref:universal stress protein n=1 Tax=Hydrogenophaga sp. TaxID=1904254 RepID=UPI0027746577|nr:universal stress protein [Hydrogenophaga sp.]|eukprot:Opistho-1_new@79115